MVLNNISPLDGRYASKLTELQHFFSEHALFKYRVKIEILYLLELLETTDVWKGTLSEGEKITISRISDNYTVDHSNRIKEIESITKHDVKAVEYFIVEQLKKNGLDRFCELVHFGLTSQDINNTAIPMMIKDASEHVIIPGINGTIQILESISDQYRGLAMLARTHGQAASPTTLGKEIKVFSERIELQLSTFKGLIYSGKFGGATGNFNSHFVAFPSIDWRKWSDNFLLNKLGIKRQRTTTQIAHYDEIAEWCHQLIRINTILIDLCRDFWTYISMDYFKQKLIKNEVGSSAMPHKVNPIDFENAEGNLGLSNALLSHLAEKLPISRLQRDLTDSTVLRNIGVPIGHTILANKSLQTGLQKVEVNVQKISIELEDQWIILAEAVQTILRREKVENPYELLKDLTRGKSHITQSELHQFIDKLPVSHEVKRELKVLKPQNYIGFADQADY